jgi:hypothetical protein
MHEHERIINTKQAIPLMNRFEGVCVCVCVRECV